MMGLTMCEGKFVGRDEIAMVPTPTATASWKPVPHSEVIDAVTDVVKAHDWQILEEQYGLARDGQMTARLRLGCPQGSVSTCAVICASEGVRF